MSFNVNGLNFEFDIVDLPHFENSEAICIKDIIRYLYSSLFVEFLMGQYIFYNFEKYKYG